MLNNDNIKIPSLKVDGTNWIMYKTRLALALEEKGLHGYLTGSNLKLMNPTDKKNTSWKPIAAEQKEIDKYPEKLLLWKKNNSYIKSLIGPSLPDSLLIKIFREETVKGI